jgi:hypothetical protein
MTDTAPVSAALFRGVIPTGAPDAGPLSGGDIRAEGRGVGVGVKSGRARSRPLSAPYFPATGPSVAFFSQSPKPSPHGA